MPSATGADWDKYRKNFADEEEPEKKITPLTDEYVCLGRKQNFVLKFGGHVLLVLGGVNAYD